MVDMLHHHSIDWLWQCCRLGSKCQTNTFQCFMSMYGSMYLQGISLYPYWIVNCKDWCISAVITSSADTQWQCLFLLCSCRHHNDSVLVSSKPWAILIFFGQMSWNFEDLHQDNAILNELYGKLLLNCKCFFKVFFYLFVIFLLATVIQICNHNKL